MHTLKVIILLLQCMAKKKLFCRVELNINYLSVRLFLSILLFKWFQIPNTYSTLIQAKLRILNVIDAIKKKINTFYIQLYLRLRLYLWVRIIGNSSKKLI